MLEKALEQLLLQFLAPYVDGISRDKLHVGVFSGSLELKDLQVKPDALALLGFDDLRIRDGKIKLIKLAVPWSKLYTGKVEMAVEQLHLEVESYSDPSRDVSEAALVVEMREAKRKAMELRVSQLRDLMEEQERKQAGAEDDPSQRVSYGVKLVRKIVNNIKIALSDVNFSFINRNRGLACGLEFPKLQVLSTDATFREQDAGEVVAVDEGHAMYKLLRLHKLGIRMAPAGSIDLHDAGYVLTPISASLQLAHVPSDQILRVRLEVATEENAELNIPRSQMKHMLAVQNETREEQDRLRALLITPEEEQTLCVDASASKAEYSALYERWLLHELGLDAQAAGAARVEPLTAEEKSRMQLIEDALSARLLARERWVTTKKVEALNEKVAQRQMESRQKALELERQSRPGLLGRLRQRWNGEAGSPAAEDGDDAEPTVWVTTEERNQLLADLDDESKVETIDLPQRFSFEFLLGRLDLDLVDDRRTSDVQRQLLQLALSEANLRIDVNMATDHRGRDSAEWSTEVRVGGFQAVHCASTLFRLHSEPSTLAVGRQPSNKVAAGRMPSFRPSYQPGEGEPAAKLAVASKLEKEQNLLELDFGFKPIEVHFLPGVVELLLEFWRSPEEHLGDAKGARPSGAPADASTATRIMRMEEYSDMALEFKEGYGDRAKAVAAEVYERIPDKMTLRVQIASPIVHVPVAGLGTAMFSLGELCIETPFPCAYDSIDLGFKLNHTTLRAMSLRNERFDMIQPVPVDIGLEYRCLDEENSLSVTVKAQGLALSLAPQALQILLATPSAMTMVLYPEEDEAEAPEVAEPPRAAPSRQTSAEVGPAAAAVPAGSMREVKKVALEVFGEEGQEVLDSYTRRIEEVRSKQFRLQLGVSVGALDVTLSDSIVPVMRLRVQMLPPGPDKPALTMEKLKSPYLLTVAVPVGTLEMDILNPRNGAWEPLTERVHLGLTIERTVKADDETATRVSVVGHEPVLLNFTPTAVRTAGWILPLFVDSLSGPEEDPPQEAAPARPMVPTKSVDSLAASVRTAQSRADLSGGAADAVKYRVVNLCQQTLELEFTSRHEEDLKMEVPPTGAGWQSLDALVLPSFATALAARTLGWGSDDAGRPLGFSEPLSLERANAVTIPGSGLVAELLTPSPSHRLLLLATPLRVHNQTDLALHLRFHAEGGDGLPLQLDGLAQAPACNATFLGHPLPAYDVASQHSDAPAPAPRDDEHALVLQPHAVACVPPGALMRRHQAPQCNIRVVDGVAGDRVYLSTNESGTHADCWSCDDESMRQRWTLTKGGTGSSGTWYTIRVVGGVSGERSYLSCNYDGSAVDLWSCDDGSGRQRWTLAKAAGGGYNIKVLGGVTDGRVYLSTTWDGRSVNLWYSDDDSGRQRWTIDEMEAAVASSHCWLSVRPAGLEQDWCTPIEAGPQAGARTVFCRRRSPGDGSSGYPGLGLDVGIEKGFYLRCAAQSYERSQPVPTMLTHIAIQPPMALLNALPIGQLGVRFSKSSSDQRTMEVRVPRLTRWNVYTFQGPSADGMALAARLQDNAQYCDPVSFSRDAFRPGSDAGQPLQLRQHGKDGRPGAAAHVLVEPLSEIELRISCPNWFVDRAGIGAPLAVSLRHWGKPLPAERGITLLPMECFEENCELVLGPADPTGSAKREQLSIRLPPSWSHFPWSTQFGSFVFCMQAESVADASLLGAQCQAITLRPRLVLTNLSPVDLELDVGAGQVKALASGGSVEHHWQARASDVDALACSLRFRPARGAPGADAEWSGSVICGDVSAGSTPFLLGTRARNIGAPLGASAPQVWSVDVAPVRGAVAVSFRQGSDFVAVCRAKSGDVAMAIRPAGASADMPVLAGQEVTYGWPQPFDTALSEPRAVEVVVQCSAASGRPEPVVYRVPDTRQSSRGVVLKLRDQILSVTVTRVGNQTILSLDASKERPAQAKAGSPTNRGRSGSGLSLAASGRGESGGSPVSSMQVEIKFSRLGISIIEEVPRPRELLFLHLELIRMEWQRDGDTRQLSLAISEAQVDCQLPGRVDALTVDRRRDDALGLLKEERPAVILANCADGDRAFLTVFLQRGATSSRDLYIPYVDVAFDTLDVTVDDEWLEPVVQWYGQLWGQGGSSRGVPFEALERCAGRPVTEEYVPPELPHVVQVDHFGISTLSLTMWCALKLRSVRFLPQHIRTAIRVLSFSGMFTLDGATLKLEERKLPPHRGSLPDFLRGLGSEYTMNLLKNTGDMLGKSSLLNLPRVPVRIGMTGLCFLSESIGVVGGEAASLLNWATFDEEYAEQQRQLRAEKQISGFHDGMVEAGKSLSSAVEGVFDIVKKPWEGAQSGGVGGFFSGFGKGLAGAIVKPISQVGQAVSDVGSGIAAQVTPDTQSMKRRRDRPRLRQPRVLYSELGVVRPWSAFEAEVQRQLGAELTQGVEAMVPLKGPEAGGKRRVLLLFPRKCAVAEVQVEDAAQEGDDRAKGSTQGRRRTYMHEERGGSSSSSARPAAKQGATRKPDFMDALDDTSSRIFSQAMKPLNTIVYGVQDSGAFFEKTLSMKDSDSRGAIPALKAPSLKKGAVADVGYLEIPFGGLQAVDVQPSPSGGCLIQLEDTEGNVNALNLMASGLQEDAIEALAAGLRQAAAHSDRVANWSRFHAALDAERRRQPDQSASRHGAEGSSGVGAGHRILEVWEVERRVMGTGVLGTTEHRWRTPSMPLDKDLCWRWVDRSGYRHPHLRKGITVETCESAKEPPCELDHHLFKPRGAWTREINSRTDKEGWRYGMAWNSSTWDRQPGLFDGMRRRRWTRSFC